MSYSASYQAAERAIRLEAIRDRAAAARPVASAALAGKDHLVVIGAPGSLASAVARRLAGR